jgi:hypothetical protein
VTPSPRFRARSRCHWSSVHLHDRELHRTIYSPACLAARASGMPAVPRCRLAQLDLFWGALSDPACRFRVVGPSGTAPNTTGGAWRGDELCLLVNVLLLGGSSLLLFGLGPRGSIGLRSRVRGGSCPVCMG